MDDHEPDVTTLLAHLREGDSGERRSAEEKLARLVEKPLHDLAEMFYRQERANPLLQPTLLANDVFMKLVRAKQIRPQNRAEFFKHAAHAIRQGLIDHARKRKSRDGKTPHVSLDGLDVGDAANSPDIEALDEMLTKLATLNPRQAQIVEMRFFAGATEKEIAEALEVSEPTVKRSWRSARIWLHQQLSRDE
jgi:RNA polymerase sigma factor (TIGR02999 family)